MKKLLCNSLVASVVAVAGATVFASQANAQSVDVDFNGTVQDSCEINKVRDGNLNLQDDGKTLGSLGVAQWVDPNGGAIKVNCTGSGIFSITTPEPVSNDAINLSNKPNYRAKNTLWRTVANTKYELTSQGPSAPYALNGNEEEMYVNMIVYNSEAVPAGDYTFKTTVTLTAQ